MGPSILGGDTLWEGDLAQSTDRAANDRQKRPESSRAALPPSLGSDKKRAPEGAP